MRRRRAFRRLGGPPPDDPRAYPPPPDEDVTVVAGEEPPLAGPPVEETVVRRRPRGRQREVREYRDAGPPPERNPWPWLLALLLLVLGGLAAAYVLSQRDDDEAPAAVAVPSLVGVREAEAVRRASQAGFRPRITRQFAQRPRGVVVRQAPAAATRLARGAPVTLFVSRGPATVSVPNLRGLTEAQAASKLTALGLRANVFRVVSRQPDGTVVAQNPGPDERVAKGEAVRINVSRGVTRTETTTTVTTPTATVTTPTTPAGGAGGTTTAPARNVTVPDVVGQREIDAAAALQRTGLLADSYPVSSEDPGGTVVAQRPAAGATIRQTSAVRLNVSVGTGPRPQRPVPDVTGLNERAARDRLRRANFTVRALPRTVTERDEHGVVILQTPDAQTPLRVRTQVTIYVGRLA